ncbi:MAG: dockerin type I domain-containing protein [Pseudomonadota bacterium]
MKDKLFLPAFALMAGLLFCQAAFSDIGLPHIVCGKVFDSKGVPPQKEGLTFHAYVTSRPEELLPWSAIGCGYDELPDGGWLWVEAGNFITPWLRGDNVRIVVVDGVASETGAVEIELNRSGNQRFSDLCLGTGDGVGPITYGKIDNRTAPIVIPEGTLAINIGASIDDRESGNSIVRKGEFFMDTDPGVGKGTPMDTFDGGFDESTEDVFAGLDVSSWTQGSTHTIGIRGQDAPGNWGATQSITLSVVVPVPRDFDEDGDVDGLDLAEFIEMYASALNSGIHNSLADLDADGDIDKLDLAIFAGDFGEVL